ncbi:hypothetical protein ACLKA6_010591 [Drosophila palustris]
MELNLGLRRCLTWPFIVADVQVAIIGADFLSQFQLLIDLTNKRLIDSTTGLTSSTGIADTEHFSISTVHGVSKFQSLLQEFVDVTIPARKTTSQHEVRHHIEVTGAPISDRPRRLAGEKLAIAKAEVNFLIKEGICRPSNSPWSSPLHMVSKRDEHEQHLRTVLEILRKHGLCINLSKCQLAQSEIQFLSYVINEHGIRPPTKRVEAIQNYERPATINQLGRFLCIINYYRRCLPNSSHIQAPLSELLRDVKKNDQRLIDWTENRIAAFEECKLTASFKFLRTKREQHLLIDSVELNTSQNGWCVI